LTTEKCLDGWELRESGPPDADYTVLLLPGALCTAAFFEALMAESRLSEASIRMVATTVQGFGGTTPPDDLSMENYARLAGKLAADLGCDLVVGHSVGANIAIEMAASAEFAGPLLLFVADLLARGRVDLPPRARSHGLCAGTPAVRGDVQDHRPRDEGQPAP
jgi:hypothetical protein